MFIFVYSGAIFELEKVWSFSHTCGTLAISKMEATYMPEISLFCGIRITMFFSDHNPPHFHADYAGQKAFQHSGGLCNPWCLACTSAAVNFSLV